MQTRTVTSVDGIELCVTDSGDINDPAVLFVHGLSQSRLAWTKQFDSSLLDNHRLVAVDLRGHGHSDKPARGYQESGLWAADLRSVIDSLDLVEPVLVGWSYGGIVVADFVAAEGDEALTGIIFVDASSSIGIPWADAQLGEDFLEVAKSFGNSDAERAAETMKSFLQRCSRTKLPPEDLYFMLGYNLVVPPRVREAMQSRTVDNRSALEDLTVPTKIIHGSEDTIVVPSAAEEHANLIGTDDVSILEAGHTPFWERPVQFNRELASFVSDE